MIDFILRWVNEKKKQMQPPVVFYTNRFSYASEEIVLNHQNTEHSEKAAT